jgi:drug/metabolite transporter (DMT)-like permease
MSANSKTLPYVAVIISSVTWGFSFLFTKNALGHLQAFQLLGYRFIVAAVILTVLAAFGLIKIRLTAAKLKGMMVVALLQPVLYFLGETFGVKLTSATESGILIALVPIAVSICSVWLLKERLAASKWVAIAVCVAGVVLIVLAKGFDAGGGEMTGVLSLLGAIVAAGFYTPLSRKVSRQSTPMEITFVMMWVGAIVFNAIGIASEAVSAHKSGLHFAYFDQFANPAVLAEIAYLGILSSIVAFFCLNYALSRLESTVVGTFTNLVPVITVFAGVVIGGESLLPLQCVGAVLILAGIWGTARRKPVPARAPLPVQPE